MAAKLPRPGGGQFQWNPGAWFGAQAGGSLWLLFLGLAQLGRNPALGALALALAVLVNLAGWLLWQRRDRLAPYPCIQALLALVGLATLAVLLAFDHAGRLAQVDAHFSRNPRGLYLLLLMFPALMGLFHAQDRAKRK